jgi:hypothetical protein
MFFNPSQSFPILAVSAWMLALTSSARAEPFTYQGFLTESDLPAIGIFDFRVEVFTELSPADPPPKEPVLPLSTELFEDVFVSGGVFSLTLDLDQSVIDAYQAGEPIYLEIGVRVGTAKDGYTTLTPRTRVRPTPFAAFAQQPVPTLQSAFDAGPTVLTLPGMQFEILGEGNTLLTTPLYLNRLGVNSITNADLSLIPGIQGGRIILRDGTETLVNIAPDPDNSGGFLTIGRGSNNTGFTVDGNFNNTQSPRVTIAGASSTSVFDGSVAGNASVVLPTGAIAATEMFNEPGVAADRATPNLTLPPGGQLQIAASRAITVPDAGFILVTGSMETLIVANATGAPGFGVNARIDYGISTTGTSIANGLDYLYRFESPPIASPGPEDIFTLGNTLGFTDVIEVSQAGTTTISAVARFSSPNVPAPVCTVRDVNINLVYIPTSYGLVAREPNADLPDEAWAPYAKSVQDLIREHRAEMDRAKREQAEQQRATARRLAELEAMVQRLSE